MFVDFFRNSSGVDVMIKIFCDFCQFLAKKMAFFSKTDVMITLFSKASRSLSKKGNILAKFFDENILKIITPVPGPPATSASFFSTAYCRCG
jgi:hypothetical protein